MTTANIIHTHSTYGAVLENAELFLLACLSLFLLVWGGYLMWLGIARCRCYRQARLTVHCLVRSTGPEPRNTAAVLTLYSGPPEQRTGCSILARKLRLSIRCLLYPRQTRHWLDYWNLTPTHVALAIATPRLLQKIYRPYQSLRLRRPERLEILTSHYDFVIRQGLVPLVLQASKQQIPIASFTGKSGDVYEVRLAAIESLDREGELALHLYRCEQHLFSTAFTFYQLRGNWCIGIGCLQGPRGADARERVRRATRDMFGLRPKTLMIRMVHAIGNGYSCSRILLVSNRNRIANRRCHANYDAFWQEMGAARRPDGDYEIPCEEPASSNIRELPSRKRAEARHRGALVRQTLQEVKCALRCPR